MLNKINKTMGMMFTIALLFGGLTLLSALQFFHFGSVILHIDLWNGNVKWSNNEFDSFCMIVACGISCVVCLFVALKSYKKQKSIQASR